MRGRRIALCALLAGVALGVASCGEEDAASVKVVLKADMSGTVSTSSVVLPPTGAPVAPVEGAAQGVTWSARGQLSMSTGSFASISQLRVADIFYENAGTEKAPMVKVIVPRGPDAKWPKLLSVTDKAQREQAARALVPGERVSPIGEVVTLTLTVPEGCRVVSTGVKGRGRGLNAAMEETQASLTVPMDVATSIGRLDPGQTEPQPLIWHITWEPASMKKP